MAFCVKCGAPYGPTSQFCRSCGTAVAQATAGTASAVAVQSASAVSASAVASPPAPVPVKKKKKVLKIIGIVVAIFFALVVWGAIIDAGKNGGKRPGESTGNSESSAAAASASVNSEAQEKDGRLMCGEIQQQLTAYLKDAIKGIECRPGAEDGGKIALLIGYPVPVLAKDDLVRKNTLFVTFTLAGSAMTRHTDTTVKKIYAVDSSGTSFAVPGDFAQQLYTKMMSNQLSEKDGKEEVASAAQRVKIPQKGH